MSVFSRIMDRIFHGRKAEAREAPAPQQSQFSPQAQAQQGGSTTQSGTQPQAVDVEKVLADMGRYLARSEFMKDQAAKAKGLQMVPVNPESGEHLEEYTKTMRNIFGH